MKPKKYDMMSSKEIRRWFREMEGYLKTEDFVHQGTDAEGRKFALDGFQVLKDTILNNSYILLQIAERVNFDEYEKSLEPKNTLVCNHVECEYHGIHTRNKEMSNICAIKRESIRSDVCPHREMIGEFSEK